MSPRLDMTDVGDGAAIARANGVLVGRRGVRVTLTAADGLTGEGEASPLPGYSPETLASVRAELTRGSPRSGAARFAIESALVDLVGKRIGASAAKVLGGALTQREVGCAAVIVEDDPAAVDAALAAGARALKLKLRGPARDEGRRLIATRARVGASIELRADANGAYDVEEARALLALAGEAGVSFVEEPTRGEALFELGGAGAPVAIDESLALPGMLDAALTSAAISVLVLKPALLGLFAARGAALRAHGAGKSVVVTHLFDGPVALAGAAAVALSLPFPPLACGLAPHDGLRAYAPRRIAGVTPLAVRDAGAPGLGLDGP